MLCADRPHVAGLALLVVLPACLCLSVFVEFTQLWFPPRVSSLNDIVAQFIGALVGSTIWLGAGQRLTNWFRGAWQEGGQGGLAARLLPCYLVLLVLIHSIPFYLTLSPADIYLKYRADRVQLIPFAAHGGNLFAALARDCWNVALLLPLGLLLEQLPGLGRRGWRTILAVAVATTFFLQAEKLLVVSRFVDTTSMVTGSLAILAGWWLALTLRQRRLAAGLSGLGRATLASQQPRHLIGLLLLVWLAAALFVNWQPFNFSLDAELAEEHLEHLSLLPFEDYYQGRYWNSFDQFIHKTLLFMLFGMLLALALPMTSRRRTGLTVLLLGALVAAGIKAGQLFLPMRYVGLTDILLGSGGAWIGLALTRDTQALHPPPSTTSACHSDRPCVNSISLRCHHGNTPAT
jgi:glycopeptide antibiotics resistance protein